MRPRHSAPLTYRNMAARILLMVAGFFLAGAGAAIAFFVVNAIDAPGNNALAQAAVLAAPTSAQAADAGVSAVSMSWTNPAPQVAGTTYKVTASPGGASCTTGASSCQVDGLSAGASYSFVVEAVLDNWTSSTTSASFTTLGVATTSLPEGTYGTAYAMTLVAAGGSGGYTWALTGGTLPPWAHLNASTGVISGTSNSASTTSGLVFTATDSQGFSAASTSLALIVNTAPLTITASSGAMTYGGSPPVIAPSYSAFADGDTFGSLTTQPTCSTTANSLSSVAGSPYASSCSGAVDANYTITYVSGSVTVSKATLTVTASNTTSTYGSAPSVSPSYSGFVNSQNSSVVTTAPTCTSTVTATTVPGTYNGANTCSGGAATNYTLSFVAGNDTVGKATLTVTASNTTSTYGSAPSVSPSYSGFVNSQNSSVVTTAPTCTSTVTATTVPGTYNGANTCSGGAATNYTLSFVAGNDTVGKATLTVTASNTTSTYGSAPSVSPSYSGFVNSQNSSVVTTAPTCTSTVTATTVPGTYNGANTCSGGAATNYTLSFVAGNDTVGKATLTVTASNTTSTYGSAPSVSPSYSGFVNSQNSSVVTTAPTCTSTVTATTVPGTYNGANTCSGGAATNYTLSFVAGNDTVGKATLTVTASNTTSTYGSAPSVSPSYSGFVNSQNSSVVTTAPTCTSTVTATTVPGTYNGANTCSGGAATNYTLSFVAGNDTVGKANQTITFTSTNPSPVTPASPNYTPTASSSSGVSVSVTLDASSTGCTLTSGVVDFTAVGTCIVDANQSGNGNYNPAGQVQQSITVNAGSPSKIVFVSGPAFGDQSGNANLGPFTIQLQDQFGDAVNAGAGGVSIGLSGPTPTSSNSFSTTQNANGNSTLTVSIASGSSSTSFYWGYSGTGAKTISANPSGTLATIGQNVSIVATPGITTTSVPSATKTQTGYTTTLAETGGTAPLTWSVVNGSLPSTLSLDPSTGVISGNVSSTTTSQTFTVQVTDADSVSDTQILTLTVNAGQPSRQPPFRWPPKVSRAIRRPCPRPGGTSPLSWILASGSLPSGLSLSSVGVISGNVSATASSATFIVQVTDANGVSDTQSLILTVNAATPSITNLNPSSTTPNTGFSTKTLNVTITGTNFVSGATVAFNRVTGSDVSVNSVTFVSSTSLTVSISVDGSFSGGTGTFSVVVTNPGGLSSNGATFTT